MSLSCQKLGIINVPAKLYQIIKVEEKNIDRIKEKKLYKEIHTPDQNNSVRLNLT